MHVDKRDAGKSTDYIHGAQGTLARITNNAVTYLHHDSLGSVQTGTDSSGAILWQEAYTPYGEALNDVTANQDLAGFTGHIKDDATGLSYMQARYYDPVIGRFYSNDPVDALGHMQRGNSIAHGFNRYAYANNNPYKYTDPDGKFAFLAPLVPPTVAALGKALGFVGTAALAGYAGSEAINAYNESSETAVPDAESGKELDPADKGGELTKAGRAGQKHGSRPGSAFPTATGDANSKNNQGQGILEDIVNNPDSTSESNQRGGTDVTAPDGKGARFDKDGKFTGFLEPKRDEQTN